MVFSDLNKDACIQPFSEDCGAVPNFPDGSFAYSEILQENNYYPFGMQMEGPWQEVISAPENGYLYNGKELNTDFDLNWLDFGARRYDPSIGRFSTIDRFAEKYYEMPPYQYAGNNPILNIDVNGDSIAMFLLSSAGTGSGSGDYTGHSAVLIMNSEGGWTYISKDKDNLGVTDDESSYTILTLDNLEEFEDADIGGGHTIGEFYNEAYVVETDGESNDEAIKAASDQAASEYDIGCNNCTHVGEVAISKLKDRQGKPLKYNGKNASTFYNSTTNMHKTRAVVTPGEKHRAIKRSNKGKIITPKSIISKTAKRDD